MNRSKLVKYAPIKSHKELPAFPMGQSPHLVDGFAGWRSVRPEVDAEACISCHLCYLVCPEGVIDKEEKGISIDLTYCKGCGICAVECPKNAIKMIRE